MSLAYLMYMYVCDTGSKCAVRQVNVMFSFGLVHFTLEIHDRAIFLIEKCLRCRPFTPHIPDSGLIVRLAVPLV